MSKNQTMKKVAMAVVAANVVASSLITAMPAKSMAAENENQGTSAGNKSETKLQSGLKSSGLGMVIQNTNFVKDPEFTKLDNADLYKGWRFTSYYNGYPTDLHIIGGKYEFINTDPTQDQTPTGIGSAVMTDGEPTLEMSFRYQNGSSSVTTQQVVNVVPGQTYKLKMNYRVSSNEARTAPAHVDIYCGNDANRRVDDIYGGSAWRAYEGTFVATTPTIPISLNVDLRKAADSDIGSNITTQFKNISLINADQTPPSAPTVNDVLTTSTTVSGKAEANSKISVKANGNEIGTAQANSSGAYTVTIPKQAYNTQLQVTAADSAGNISDATTVNVKQAVSTPYIDLLTTKSTTASGVGDPGASIVFKANGINYSTTVNANGTWSVSIPRQSAYSLVEATATLMGSTAKASKLVLNDGPSTPVLDNVTNKSTSVTGKGDRGNTVTIKVTTNGSSVSYVGTVDDFGTFSVKIDPPEAGATVEAIAKDSDNDLSQKATKTVLDVIAPDAPSVNAVKETDTIISGTGEANCDVAVKLPNGSIVSGRTNSQGAFSITIPKQAVGANIEVSLTDAAGNKGTATTVTVQADTLANPTVNRVSNQDTKVTGTGVAGATVNVQANNTTYTDTVKEDGTYEVTVPKLAAGTSVSVEQTKSGVTSGSVTTIVEDDAVPSAPTVNAVKDTDTVVTGTATAGNLVSVKIGDGNYSAVVAANGTYSITIPAQASGTKISVTAKNTANDRVSTATQVTVTDTTLGAPAIDGVNTASTNVTVTGEKGALISVRLPDGTVLTKVADNTGKAVISIPKQTAGAVLTATQTGANGKASAAASVTVVSNTLAAPTINDYYATAGYVTGKAPTGASKIALYVDNQLVRYGAIDSNGNYQIYAADNTKMNTAGTAFQVVAVDADGNMGTKANATVQAKIAVPSINDYYTTDVYAKGTATGASKVTLYVNGKAVRTAAVNANGSYSIYTGDQASLATAGATFQISASNTAGVESPKTTGTVKTKLTAPVINKYVATDAYARGTASVGSKQVVLYVDGKAVRTAAVNADGTYAIYTGDQVALTVVGNTFQIASKDAVGNESPKATGTVVSVLAAPTIATYYTTDVYATGTTPAGATKVALYVDGKFVRYATVTDGKFSIYTGDQAKLATAGNEFQIASVDAKGTIGNMATATVQADNRAAYQLAATGFNMATDQNVSGTAGSSITRVKIFVNGDVKRQTSVADGVYAIYAKDVITSASDTVEIAGYDAQGFERNRVTVPVTSIAPATYNVTADKYNVFSGEYVTGTADAAVTRVKLVVNGVDARTTTTANGAYSIYAQDKITSASDNVQIVALDKDNVARKTITVQVVNDNPSAKVITPADYTIGTDNIIGAFGSDIKKVQLFVDGTFARQAAITGNSFTVYAADKVTSASQKVEMVGFDASGTEVARQAVNVK
ncbi:Ig-like domain-containing protein [Listeria booriae]|uniref:Ig-like domain-containing protein n=1 Tax=Listeria booriae TaxID=1552123 RepID=UPI0028808926|nr:Ig-like domain-containing protein [Listeria booriae]MDT0112079.1 Ig-like domain-containing protein [Listeria booriae]